MKSETPNLAELVGQRIEESVAVKRALLAERELIAAVGEKLIEAYRAGRKLLIFGNGGSASDAQHIAAELVGRYYFDRRALPAEALTVNASSLTAISNDYSFDHVFARQVEALGNAGDVAVGISTSGNSANVIEGVRAAKRLGLVTVALTGAGGGRLKGEVDYCVSVPSTDTPRVQEAHALIGHVWCEMVERALFGDAVK
jgi:D-sedoheptulose 7-phosphate isomerase